MTFSVKYKELFSVTIYHLFFLNNGGESFLSMTDEGRSKRLKSYEISSIISIKPSNETQRILAGQQLIVRYSGSQLSVWTKVDSADETKPFIELSDDLQLTFLVKIIDPAFLNYTNLKLENAQKIYYFSNKRLSTEVGTFPLINKKGDNSGVDQSFILSESGNTNEMAKLSIFEQQNLFGIIKLFMKGETSSLDITDSNGKINNPKTSFELLFENRRTFWRYIFNKDQTVVASDDIAIENTDNKILITKTDQPLTSTGFVSVELGGVELPNPDYRLIKPDASNNKIYSEIFIYT